MDLDLSEAGVQRRKRNVELMRAHEVPTGEGKDAGGEPTAGAPAAHAVGGVEHGDFMRQAEATLADHEGLVRSQSAVQRQLDAMTTKAKEVKRPAPSVLAAAAARSIPDGTLGKDNTLKRYAEQRGGGGGGRGGGRRRRRRNLTRDFPRYPGRRQTRLDAAIAAGTTVVETAALAASGAAAAAAAPGAAAAAATAATQLVAADAAPIVLDQALMPLHLFDSDVHEAHSPAAWLQSGSAARSPYYLGADQGFAWLPCEVLGYDEASAKYEVRFEGAKETKGVRRLNLRFELEDGALFERRVHEAEARREAAKAQLRFDHFVVNQLRGAEVRGLQPATLGKIHAAVVRGLTVATQGALERAVAPPEDADEGPPPAATRLRALLDEVAGRYTHATKCAALRARLASDPRQREALAALQLPLPALTRAPPPPRWGKVQIPPSAPLAYGEYRAQVLGTHWAAHREIVSYFLATQRAWHAGIARVRFTNTALEGLALPCALADFEAAQVTQQARAAEALRVDWHKGAADGFVDAAQEVHDIYQSDIDVYRASALARLLRAVALRMRDQLRDWTAASIRSWWEFLCRYVDGGAAAVDAVLAGQDGGGAPLGSATPTSEEAEEEEEEEEEEEGNVEEDDEEPQPGQPPKRQRRIPGRVTVMERMSTTGVTRTAPAPPRRRPTYRKAPGGASKEVRLRMRAEDKEAHEEEQCAYAAALVEELAHKRRARALLPAHPPLFTLVLRVEEAQVILQPSAEQIECALLAVPDTLEALTSSFERIDAQVMGLLTKHLSARVLFDVGGQCASSGAAAQSTRSELAQLRCTTRALVHRALEAPRRLVALVGSFAEVMDVDAETFADNFAAREPPPQLADFRREIARLGGVMDSVPRLAFDHELFSLARVDTTAAKAALHERARELRQALLGRQVQLMREQAESVHARFATVEEGLNKQPASEAELHELKTFLAGSAEVIAGLEAETRHVHECLDTVSSFQHRVSFDDFRLAWGCKEWPERLVASFDMASDTIELRAARMMDALSAEKERFEALQDQLEKRALAFRDFGGIENQHKYYDASIALQDELAQAKATGEDLNRRDEMLGFPRTEYPLIAQIEKGFTPFCKLWTMCQDFDDASVEWLNGSLLALDFAQVEKQVSEWWRLSYKMSKSFRDDSPGCADVALALREKTTSFKEFLPLVQALSSDALRVRHWAQLSEDLSRELGEEVELDGSEQMTLDDLVKFGLVQYMETIQQTSVAAEKEYSLEKALKGMKAEWEDMNFEVLAYKNTGTHLVKGVDDIVTLLDDHVVKTQTMRGSPFIKPIAVEAANWEHSLHAGQAALDEWIACQRTWLYLQPIFDSDDIMRQMPTEGRRFQAVDQMWRKNMEQTVADPNFMRCAGRDKLLDKFRSANQTLDTIQKGLNDYLETKRLAFARFFFLSNDELLEILSQTKDPLLVQPHLGKCFEGVAKCRFEKGAEDLACVISQEGEAIELLEPIHPLRGRNKGNVENWMLELEQMCWDTLKTTSFACMDAYATTLGSSPAHTHHVQAGGTVDLMLGHSVSDIAADNGHTREMWMIEWPAMLVLAVSQIYWTRAAWNVLRTAGEQGLHDYYDELNEQLGRIVQRVRGKLNKIERKTIGALVVMDVHARDTTKKMEHAKVDRDDHFEWMSQLRYYWLPQDGTFPHQDTLNSKIGDHFIMARIVNAELAYGYEYLGNSMRLVVTPLTDRCYRTMMGAVGLNYGGAPEGPAGTGKTETVKDLAKAVALQCVVFNCSDGLDYQAMGKFFKGLAACGAWSCFDEFNRINIEVLSVIAQQILEINVGKRNMQAENAKHGGFKEFKFHFEGSYIKLNPNANPFITMNPGYAGRAELPDNLKALFRPCAMMVPDYAMIGEIMLYSFGFSDAKNNARKLVGVLQLSSEQLSSQRHYDYGMRAVFSILVAAGSLRLSLGDDPEWSEDRITLRAIRDVNLPKFLEGDLPLFSGITADLFPGVMLDASDHGSLIPSLRDVCRQGFWLDAGADGMQICKLEPNPDRVLQVEGKGAEEFLHKCVQLYETHLVRHSLMLVGPTMGGKTHCFHALGTAMTLANSRGDSKLDKVRITTINPKSIHPNFLYGNFDENTHEWSDGVLAIQFRNMSKDTDENGDFVDRNWLLFDGPVDAVWIENMNTVMDENKKLCLMSGEIIKMSPLTRMMFEPEDLAVASPATVSRNGIVFLEPSKLGWACLVDSWIEVRLPKLGWAEDCMEGRQDFVRGLFDWLVPPCLYQTLRHCTTPIPIAELELVASLMTLLDCFWDLREEGIGSDQDKALESTFVLALVWSIGGGIDKASRTTFDHMLRVLLSGSVAGDQYYTDFLLKNPAYGDNGLGDSGKQRRGLGPIPPGDIGLIYDFTYDAKKLLWKSWTDGVPKFHIDKEAEFTSILVPNIDTIRNDYLLQTLLEHGHHVMFGGDTGTGKSASVKEKLLEGMPERFQSMFINFSAATKAGAVQALIDSKLTKRRKGFFGAPPGKTCVIFVDDLNMPAKEEFGAQPPIEILRQWMDHKSWWDLKDFSLRNIIDVQFVTAMGPPGGGRNHITQRYTRHFNLIMTVPFSDDALDTVFSSILQWSLSSFGGAVKAQAAPTVAASIALYHKISAELLPTPAKSHYTFNLRDLSKVFQGLTQGSPDLIKTAPDFTRLWAHENYRVYHDRLVDAEDRVWFRAALAEIVKEHFHLEWAKVRGPHEVLLYANFADPKASKKVYEEVIDREALGPAMDSYLDDYNAMAATPMKLVLFFNAVEHVARISRVIQLPFGNSLLVGVGGSGRKSVTALATSIAEYSLFQIEITKTYGNFEWFEDLKKVMCMAGRDNQPTVFLFSDTQIKLESFLEDINGILNTGEVAGLFPPDEYTALMEAVRADALEAGCTTDTAQWNFFVGRVRTNLHLVLALSPIGDDFRRRLRMFPAFVNCTTIDWFTEWPEDALRQVATFFLHEVEMDDKTKAACIDVCVDMQSRVSAMSVRFLERMRRNYYVTPTSYLALINTFENLLTVQREAVMGAKQRYVNGLQKLAETEEQVDGMREELTALQPKLVVATKETDELIETVKGQQVVADSTKVHVEADEKVCAAQAAEALAMKTDCEEQLAEAIPALEAAVKALSTLSKSDIVEVKAMKKPPDGVKLTMEAICHMMGIKPMMVKDPDGGTKKIADYWVVAQKELLGDPRFLQHLFEYDKDNISQKIVDKVTPYTKDPLFDPAKVANASKAAAGLCKWVHALIIYDRVAKVVGPKKAALKIAISDMETAQAALKVKQDELAALMAKLAALQEQLDAAVQKSQDLELQVEQCSNRLARAASLIDGLGGEKVRWREMSDDLQVEYDNVTGDILLASGVIAYLGAFTVQYREEATEGWASILRGQGISCAERFKLADTLGEAVKIREWTIQKLPNDAFSIDNAIMLERSDRWPLMIDPQAQANKWVRNLESENDLKLCKQNQSTFVRTIENAISFGQPVLLENVPEALDPILESVLLKTIVTAGGISTIRLGDSQVEYDPKFRLYMTTKLPNPHYSPETCVKVNLLNFMATAEGLQDQMQGLVVATEQPELEKKRELLVLEDAANKKQLKEIEDLILKMLKEAEGNILDDEVLITTLADSKKTATVIEQKVKAAMATTERLQKVRESYEPVAFRSAQLFFCIADLCSVDPMYQYSLDWYIDLFLLSGSCCTHCHHSLRCCQ
jgi:dynein heavy chain